MKAKLFLGFVCGVLVLWFSLSDFDEVQSVAISKDQLQSNQGASEDSRGPQVLAEVKQLGSAKAERQARIAENPDAYWDPDRTGRDYKAKVIRHNQISQFLTSSRRDDPAYRSVMIKLLENGYDLSEWVDFVGIASQYHLPVALARTRLETEGFLPHEIEEELVPVRAHQSTMRQHIVSTCRMVMGIQDVSLIDDLLDIELPYAQGDQVLGVGPLSMIRGDRLHTEQDWLDDEFRAAKERYTGPPRNPRDISRPVLLESQPEGILSPSEFKLPEVDDN